MDQVPFITRLDDVPTHEQIVAVVKSLPNAKSPGDDGIEFFKCSDEAVHQRLVDLVQLIWREETVPQQLKNATKITIFNKKGSRSDCGSYRGISLLPIATKMLTKVITFHPVTKVMSRRMIPTSEGILSESQCGFRHGRGTVDMIFAAKQLQEKTKELQVPLCAVFVDLIKAFDTVSRTALWEIPVKLGVSRNFSICSACCMTA